MGEAPPPSEISLLVSVWPYEHAPRALYTPVGKSNGAFDSFSFYVPGVEFKLLVGGDMPDNLRKMSLFGPEGYIYSAVKGAEAVTDLFGTTFHNAVPKGKLATSIRP